MSAVRLVPWVLHEGLEYLLGVFLVLAPFLFADVRDTVAFPLFVAVGVVVLAIALVTPGVAEIAAWLPVRVHATLDYLMGLFLILSPFLFQFTDVDPALFVAVFTGLVLFVVTLLTRFPVASSQGTSTGGGRQADSGAEGSAAG